VASIVYEFNVRSKLTNEINTMIVLRLFWLELQAIA